MDHLRSATVWRSVLAAGWIAVVTAPALLAGCGGDESTGPTLFQRTDLVSDVEGRAPVIDANLVNAWGVAYAPTGPFWVSDNGQGVSTLYNGVGAPFPIGSPLVVTVDGVGDAGTSPTGIVFNPFNAAGDFAVSEGDHTAGALFIFDTEDGTLSAWNPDVDATHALLVADHSDEALYKGLAIGTNAQGNFLYATNFEAGTIEVFDKNFDSATLSGNFTDPNIPAGFAPFGIQNVGGNLYVTYAKQDADREDDVAGPGNGYVDVFDTSGNLIRRFASQGTLNSPWGLAIAPSNFGGVAGALLVGNFGDGRINAFATSDGKFLGPLLDSMSQPLTIPGLWGLIVGNGANAGNTNTIYFTAGPDGEAHGLFGSVQPIG